MRIYSFYQNVSGLDFQDEFRLAVLWRNAWLAAGFEPIILNEGISMKHQYYPEYVAAVEKLPTINPVEYEKMCYLRHLALARSGGGWMSDLDVMPQGDSEAFKDILRHLEGPTIRVLQAPCCPSLVYETPEAGLWLCEQFATGIGNKPQGDRAHYSDQYALSELVEAGRSELVVDDVVKLHGDVGWQEAPAVHYANACMDGKKPRWKWIPKLRK